MRDRSSELAQSVVVCREALRHSAAGTPERAARSNELGSALFELYQERGDEALLEEALASFEQATATSASDPEELSLYWHNRSVTLRVRHVQKGAADDLEAALHASESAIAHAPPAALPRLLTSLANVLRTRYGRHGESADLERAIGALERAVSLTLPDSPEQGTLLNGLGGALAERFSRARDPALLERAIECFARALDLMPAGSPHRPVALGNLAAARLERYEMAGRREDLEGAIVLFDEAIRGSSPGSSGLSLVLTGSSQALAQRYARHGDPADLERAIAAIRSALAETPGGATARAARLNQLGIRLIEQFERAEDGAVLEEAVTSLDEAVARLAPGSPDRPSFSNNLGNGLRLRYHRTGDARDLARAIDLYREAIEQQSPTSPGIAGNLGTSLIERYARQGDAADLAEALACSEQAVAACAPGSHSLSGHLTNLGSCLREIDLQSGTPGALTRAVECLERAAGLVLVGSPERPRILNHWSLALHSRYRRTGDLGDLERAVERSRQAVDQSSRAAPSRLRFLTNLSGALVDLFERRSRIGDLREAILAVRQAIAGTAAGSADLAARQGNLGGALMQLYGHTGREEDLEASIASLDAAVRLTPEGSADRPGRVANLGNGLLERYQRKRAGNDLEVAIACLEEALAMTPEISPRRPGRLLALAGGLRERHRQTRSGEDLARGAQAFEDAARTGLVVAVEDALRSASNWLDWAFERESWGEVRRAYDLARDASDQLVKLQPVRSDKEAWLRESQGLSARAAYGLAREGLLVEAVLALERGRAQLLVGALERDQADLRRLALRHEDLQYAYRRAAERVAWLEMDPRLDAELPPGHDPLAEARSARRELDEVIRRIREIPEFGQIFSSVAIADVRRACEGSVGLALVYLATTPAGSLALVVTGEALERLWLDLDQGALDRLLVHRSSEGDEVSGFIPGMLSGDGFAETLAQLLPLLGEGLMGPVARRLEELGVAHVALIPSGRLTLLPLHAAWIGAGETAAPFLDAFVTTYAPNARALGIARRLAAERRGTPTLVGVGNPAGAASRPLPAAEDELRNIAARFPAPSRHLLEGEGATRAAVLASLPEATHIHFACHGFFDLDDPARSRLELSGSEALTLGDLLRGEARPAAARLAVLSACQSAVSDFDRLPDELIGLPAGFLQAGVPGVVGTLWRVDDLAMALLMSKLYEYHLAGDRSTGVAPIDPPAALQRAVQWLRRLTRQDLEEICDARRRQTEAGEGLLLSAQTAAAGLVRILGVDHPRAHPFADRPVDWAGVVAVGV